MKRISIRLTGCSMSLASGTSAPQAIGAKKRVVVVDLKSNPNADSWSTISGKMKYMSGEKYLLNSSMATVRCSASKLSEKQASGPGADTVGLGRAAPPKNR